MLTVLIVLLIFWPLLLLVFIPKLGVTAGLLYTAGQQVSWWATAIGWVLLIYPCWKCAWVPDAVSNNLVRTGRTTIDRWSWEWLNAVWGNPEDGVSGRYAILGDGTPYMPTGNPSWRAYCWAALRNSCDGMKYLLEWDQGPLVVLTILGRQVRIGWLPMPQLKGAPRLPVLG